MIRAGEQIPREVDCLVLGGGITGAGVARDAAMRGLRTLLVDSHDFASGTSHLTSKLIHGGFRYLEHWHLRLVIEGIIERERLMNHLAPHLVRPLRFVLPFEMRKLPKWLMAVGVVQGYGLAQWLHSGRRSSAFWGTLRREFPFLSGPPLGIAFWDAQANDARLVYSVLRSAEQCGATLWNYTSLVDASFESGAWNVSLRREGYSWDYPIRARTLVNATGPWSHLTARLLECAPQETQWIKGSHILLRRPSQFGSDAIIIRSLRDGRALWAVPWENRVLVGSTESRYAGDLRRVRPTPDEIDDLFDSIRGAFPLLGFSRDDIRCAYAGVRPIADQTACSENSLSRRHSIQVDAAKHLITVAGGKLTTFRKMAEQAVDEMDRLLQRPSASRELRRRLRSSPLWPGFKGLQLDALRTVTEVRGRAQGISPEMVHHLVKAYGHDATAILDDVGRRPDWGRPLAEGLPYCLAELIYLCRAERVCHLLDLLKRRTPLYFLADEGGFGFLPEAIDDIAHVLNWDSARSEAELESVANEYSEDLEAVGVPLPQIAARMTRAVCA
jgi:glycerol-3-phosphate dehydrogenase